MGEGENEQQLLRFADNIPEPIIYFDRDLRYRFVNRAFLEYRGVARTDIIGRTVEEVRGSEFAAALRPLVREAFDGKPALFERLSDECVGEPRWTRTRLVPDFAEDGGVEGVYAVIIDIDEAKRAQQALVEAESRVRLFTDNIPEPLAYLGADDRFAFVNQAYINGVQLPRERIIGRSIADVLGVEAAAYFAPYIERVKRGERCVYERQRPAPDGRDRWIRGVLVPDYGDDGRYKGIYLVVHDIHDLKLAQAALAQRESQFRAFMDGIPAPVAYLNRDGRYEYVNRAFVDFSEIEAADLQGRRLSDISSAQDYERQAPLLARALAGETISYERLTPFANRAQRWMQVRLVPERDTEGNVAGVFVLLNDIHSQKENEAAIRHINWVLTSHMENTPMAVMEWDRELRLIRWSRRAEDIFGWTAEEVLGSTLHDWRLVYDDDVPLVEPVIREMLSGTRNASTGINRNKRKDGSVIWCEWHNSVLRDDHGNVLSILSFAQDVSDRVDAQERLETMATHDALTGLPNRILLHRKLTDVLARARQRQKQVAVLFIDLDRFKNVNDSLGHRIGDELLKLISRRLVLALRKGDFLARLGGDEFTVLLENLAEPDGARQVATKLLDVIEQPYWVHGHLVHVSASIGMSLFPDDGEDPDTLLKNADVAMYRAKEAGRNVYQFFTHEMAAHQQEKMTLENALRQAVRSGALSLAFQPKVHIKSGRIVGAEALLRWHDPVLGTVPPARFIPVAEESGLIDAIGDWVLGRACRETQHWAAAGVPGMTVAVNLSVRQFRDPAMAMRIERIFEQTNVDPRQVEFEVTESSVLYDAETVSRVLQLERELGVRVAIDDFGTGYSSLVHLKHLPIDTLKIDQSFIRDITTDPDDKAITAAIIALAHTLNLDVVAEGVETAEQLAFLTERGCDYYQGNYFSEPIDSAAFIGLVRNRQGEGTSRRLTREPAV
jgi:diguanylate cyclase (GGDEF)-like protein/PAS domain S-box-containing protein